MQRVLRSIVFVLVIHDLQLTRGVCWGLRSVGFPIWHRQGRTEACAHLPECRPLAANGACLEQVGDSILLVGQKGTLQGLHLLSPMQ